MSKHEKQMISPRDNGYIRRFSRVIEYIYANLDQDPDLATLAEIAALSPWHWHRVWRCTYGESIIATVKRLRLHRAAADLSYSDTPIAKIAKRAGYGSLEAFGRSFKQVYGLSPSSYRSAGSEARLLPAHAGAPTSKSTGHSFMHKVEIKALDSEDLAVLRHKGSYMEIGKAITNLIGILVSRKQTPRVSAVKAFYFSDPTHVAEDELRSAAGVVIEKNFQVEEPLERITTRGGDYAVMRHKGPYHELKSAYEWLFGEWLTQSGREPDDAPCMEIYLNHPKDTAPAELLTDICLPLKPIG